MSTTAGGSANGWDGGGMVDGGMVDGGMVDGGMVRSVAQLEWSVAVGSRVRVLRERAGLAPSEAAAGVRATLGLLGGLDGGRWRDIEHGVAGALGSTTVDEVIAMALVLGVTAEQLMDTGSPLPAVDAPAGPR